MSDFDIGIHLWSEASIQSSQLTRILNPCAFTNRNIEIIRIIKICLAYYWNTMIKPYLQFGDQIEMDETACKGQGDYNHLVTTKMFRWIFGMFCRKTKLVVMDVMIHRRA